jgi:hypothetical protein
MGNVEKGKENNIVTRNFETTEERNSREVIYDSCGL